MLKCTATTVMLLNHPRPINPARPITRNPALSRAAAASTLIVGGQVCMVVLWEFAHWFLG